MKFVINIGSASGLGNRLHILISSMRLAHDHYNMDYIVDWHTKKYKFDEIFDPSDLLVNNINYKIDKPISHDITSNSEFYMPNNNVMNRSKQIVHKSQIVNGYNIGFPILESELHMLYGICNYKGSRSTLSYVYNKTPEYFKNIYLPYFQKIKPSPNVNKLICDFITHNFGMRTIGLHVRLGDKATKHEKREKIIGKYIKFVDNEILINNVSRFFISCDEDSIEIYFKCRYGDKIIHYPHTYDTDQSDDITSAVCMYLLAKCNVLVCMGGSTFSEIAWWLGGCKDIILL